MTKIFKTWGSERVEEASTIKENYLPKYYGEGAVCLNEHYIFTPKYQHLILELSKEQAEQLRDQNKAIMELADRLLALRKRRQSFIERIYEEAFK